MRRPLALLLAVVCWASASGPAAARPTQAGISASASATRAAPGEVIQVGGEGWPDAAQVQVQVCGNEARAGSVDCDLAGTATTSTADGRFGVALRIGLPPTPCPCVVWVTTPSSTDNVRIPLEVDGAATAPPQQPPASAPRGLDVVSANVVGTGPVLSWFGARPERTLELRVRNPDSVPQAVALVVEVSGRRVDVEDQGTVPGGGDRVLRVPVSLDLLQLGSAEVAGTVGVGDAAEGFSASTSSYPWALLLLVVGAVVGLLRWVLRRRSHQRIP